MAAAAIASAMVHNLSVPAELSIAGFDDSPLAMATSPKLTTVEQPISLMAEKAVEVLINLIKAKNSSGEIETDPLLLKFKVKSRESTSSPKESWYLA